MDLMLPSLEDPLQLPRLLQLIQRRRACYRCCSRLRRRRRRRRLLSIRTRRDTIPPLALPSPRTIRRPFVLNRFTFINPVPLSAATPTATPTTMSSGRSPPRAAAPGVNVAFVPVVLKVAPLVPGPLRVGGVDEPALFVPPPTPLTNGLTVIVKVLCAQSCKRRA